MDREDKRYESMISRLNTLKKPNREVIMVFLNELKANDVGFSRRIQVGGELKRTAEFLGDRFLSPERKDIMNFMNMLKDEKAKDRTRNHYVITLKQFYRWKFKTKEAPEFVDWLKLKRVDPLKKARIDRTTVINLIDHMRNQRDKVLTMLLFESGMRFGEAVALQRKDIDITDYGMKITVAGREEGAKKTGSRIALVIGDSIAEMRRYLPSRPEPPDTYIFPMLYGDVNKPCNYDSYVKNLKKSMSEIGLNFNIHAHLFRSNYASDLVERGINQGILEKQLGWTKASRTARFYIDVTDAAQEAGIRRAHGQEPEEASKKQETVELKTCPRCGKQNPSYAKQCYNCWMSLDISEAMKLKEKEDYIQKELEGRGMISPQVNALIENMPETERTGILASIIEMALKEKEKKEKS